MGKMQKIAKNAIGPLTAKDEIKETEKPVDITNMNDLETKVVNDYLQAIKADIKDVIGAAEIKFYEGVTILENIAAKHGVSIRAAINKAENGLSVEINADFNDEYLMKKYKNEAIDKHMSKYKSQ